MSVYVCLALSALCSSFSSTALTAHPTLESYVRIFERSRNSWWFGYGVVGSPVYPPSESAGSIFFALILDSSSTIARDFSADNRTPRRIHNGISMNFSPRARAQSLALPPLSLIFASNRRRWHDFYITEISLKWCDLLNIPNTRTYELWSFKKTAYKTFLSKKFRLGKIMFLESYLRQLQVTFTRRCASHRSRWEKKKTKHAATTCEIEPSALCHTFVNRFQSQIYR